MKKILILTEGKKETGFGHVARCVSLGQALEAIGIKSEIVINGDSNIRHLLEGRRYKILDWIESGKALYRIIRSSDIVIIDSYLAAKSIYEDIAGWVKRAVYIDDNKRLDYPAGIVVNGSIYAGNLKYKKRQDTIYLLGAKYALLRKEFWPSSGKKVGKEVKSVLVTFGGNDKKNMTVKVLRFLISNYPAMVKRVVVGRGFKDIGAIMMAKDKKTEIIRYPRAGMIRNAMLKSDIAISAGGQTLYELARIGVPTIGICLAENQKRNLDGWRKAGFLRYAGWHEEKDLLNNVGGAINKFMSSKNRYDSSRAGKAHIDGLGSLRIADFLENFIRTEKGRQ